MRQLPVDYDAGRFLLRVELPVGRAVRMLVDTGGGFALDRSAADGLPIEPTGIDGMPDGVRLPIDPPVPPCPDGSSRLAVLYEGGTTGADGVLPAHWFEDRVWCFDHVHGDLSLVDPGQTPTGTAVPLGYPWDEDRRIGPFPRITATIDGLSHELLLDTGATTATLTDAAIAELAEYGEPGPAHRATSFMIDSVVDRWIERHPDWPVIAAPTRFGRRMIKVDGVVLAEVDLGPVWFESRPDRNFHEHMSSWMDRRIDGALGNNSFRGRRLILDVPAAMAYLD